MLKKILIVVALLFIGIQFIPVERTNPQVTQNIDAPANISSILRTSCYDCHSNETTWPWYSYVAPVSFFVTSDVNNGRKRINFSEWDKYDEKKKEKKLEHVIEMVEEGEMPLPSYTLIHGDAKLDQNKIQLLKDWVKGNGSNENSTRYQHEHNDDDD